MRIITLLIASAVVYLLLRWIYQKNPKQFSQKAAYLGLFAIIIILAFLAVTGRLHWLFVLLASLIPIVRRYLPLIFRMLPVLRTIRTAFQTRQSSKGPTSGQTSSVQSHYFSMELNHDAGTIEGTVLNGEFSGNKLSNLQTKELKMLLKEIRGDKNSEELFRTYLQHRFGEEDFQAFYTNESEHAYQKNDHVSSMGEMTVEDAREILGVDESSSEEEIIKAHRRLMQKFHPDRGGSNYLAVQINMAKEILLKH